MIVVLNPSGQSGHSFKGLHLYCAHDPERSKSADRVAWMETRNLATDDPDQAWKIMAATAQAQNQLKRDAGIRTGRASQNGPVLHAVLSFDNEEPQSREDMSAAANEFLSHLGADPAKMRGKSKPSRRQFADEHQVIMYAHTDTNSKHLHLVINRVHPETGLNLPSNNDQIKAQKWALKYSKRHGTDSKTPARGENMAARERGEYVKGERRKSRNAYEQDKAMQQARDPAQAKMWQEEQRKLDHRIELKGRNLAALQRQAWDRLSEAHQQRKAAIARALQRESNKAKAAIREEYRPQKRALSERQAAERRTFEALERSFFGRAGNVFKTMQLSKQDIGEQDSGLIRRTFQILTKAGERQAYFNKAQEREQKALEAELQAKQAETLYILKQQSHEKLVANRVVFAEQRQQLEQQQEKNRVELQKQWAQRNADRAKAFELFTKQEKERVLEQERAKASSPNQLERKPLASPRQQDDEQQAHQKRIDELAESFKRARDNQRERGRNKDKDRER